MRRRTFIVLVLILTFLTLIDSIVQKEEISIDDEIDIFSSSRVEVVGEERVVPISINNVDTIRQMQELNRRIINQRREINHLKAQLARCVAGRDVAEDVLDGNVPSASSAMVPTFSTLALTLIYYAYVLRQRVRSNKLRERDIVASSRQILVELCNEFLVKTTRSKFRIEGKPSSKDLAEWIQRRGRWEECPIKTRPSQSINYRTPRFRFQDAIHLCRILNDATTTVALKEDSTYFKKCERDLSDRLNILKVRLDYVRRVLIRVESSSSSSSSSNSNNDDDDEEYAIESFDVSSSSSDSVTTYVSKHNNLDMYESTCLNFQCVRGEKKNEWLIRTSTSKVIECFRTKNDNQQPWDSDSDVIIKRLRSKDVALSLARLLVTKHGRRSIPQDILIVMDTIRVRQEIERRLAEQKTKEDIQMALEEAFRAGLDEKSSCEVRRALKKLNRLSRAVSSSSSSPPLLLTTTDDIEHKDIENKTDIIEDVTVVSHQEAQDHGPVLTVPNSSEIESLARGVAKDSGLSLSRAKEILVAQYFRHNTEMLKERQQWLRHREQQEQRAMLFMDDQRQRWERLKKMNEEEKRRRDQDRVEREKSERENRKQNELHFRTMYEMKRGKIQRKQQNDRVSELWNAFRTTIFLDAIICAMTMFLSSLRALELLKVLDDMYSNCEPTSSRWFLGGMLSFPQHFCTYFVHAKLFLMGMFACISYGLVQNYVGTFVAQIGVLTIAYLTIYEQVVQELEKMQMLIPSIGYNIIFASILLLYADSSYFENGRNRWLSVVYVIFPISAVFVGLLCAVFYFYPEDPFGCMWSLICAIFSGVESVRCGM